MGFGSPVVKVPDHGRQVMRSSPVPPKTRRVGQRCTLNLSRVEMSSLCKAKTATISSARSSAFISDEFQSANTVSRSLQYFSTSF
ncbi:hypothetical protein TNCV_2429031 [Trichonephila clavipes]|nr:hypothetical protein TNCV_2429031 [Trichonephila clavipes]